MKVNHTLFLLFSLFLLPSYPKAQRPSMEMHVKNLTTGEVDADTINISDKLEIWWINTNSTMNGNGKEKFHPQFSDIYLLMAPSLCAPVRVAHWGKSLKKDEDTLRLRIDKFKPIPNKTYTLKSLKNKNASGVNMYLHFDDLSFSNDVDESKTYKSAERNRYLKCVLK